MPRAVMQALSRASYPRDAGPWRGAAAEVERHRLLRRGIPFGPPWPDTGEHGFVFLAYRTSIVRQFEYVQRKWLNAQGSDPARGGWPVAC